MKKLTLLFGILALAIVAAAEACDKSEPQEPETVEEVKFEIYDNYTGRPADDKSYEWVDFDGVGVNEGKLHVINSDEEFRNYISGDYPVVDFSQQTLLLIYGKESVDAGPNYIRLQRFSGRRYEVTVNVSHSYMQMVTKWLLAIVVDKLDAEDEVELSLTRGGVAITD